MLRERALDPVLWVKHHTHLVRSLGNSLPDAIGCAGYMKHLPKKHLSGSIESRPCVSTFASTLEVSFKPLLAHMNCSTKAHFYRIQGYPMTKSSRKTARKQLFVT